MKVDHTGNTCSVGFTCLYIYDATQEEIDYFRDNFGCRTSMYIVKHKQGYVDIHIQDWGGLYSYLTLIGIEISKFPRGLEGLGDKWKEWVAYGYPEVKQFVVTNA